MKLHLNNSRVEEIDRVSLLNFFDAFSHLFKYSTIKSNDCKLRSRRNLKSTKVVLFDCVDEFEIMNEKMNFMISDVDNN